MKRLQTLLVLLLGLGLNVAAWAGPEPMLPRADDGKSAITGWLMSEKLDGVRGSWDGQQLWSKNGILFQPPPEFVADLPPFALEGELWGGRGSFAATAAVVQRRIPHTRRPCVPCSPGSSCATTRRRIRC